MAGVYINGTQITSMSIGGISNPPMLIDGVQIFPSDNYTYALTDVALKYSSGTYLMADQSNYAWVEGTYVTYKNGSVYNTQKVICFPLGYYQSDMVKLVNNAYLYWNKDKYGTTTKSFGSFNLNGGSIDSYSKSKSLSLSYGANRNNNISNATISQFTIGGYSSPHTFASTAQSLPIYIKGTRTYSWTSGIVDRTVATEGGVQEVSLDVSISVQTSQCADCTMEITNTSQERIELIAYAEDYCQYDYYDEGHYVYDEDTDTDYEIIDIEPDDTYTVSLRADATPQFEIQSEQHTYDFYITVGNTRFALNWDDGYTRVNTIHEDATINAYFTVSEDLSWASLSGLSLTLTSANAQRSGTITVKDNAYTTATVSYALTQSAPSYTLAWYNSYSAKTATANMTTSYFDVLSYNDNGAVAISSSDVVLTNGASVSSISALSGNRYRIYITHPTNTSTTSTKTYRITVTQPNSSNSISGTLTQSKATSSTYVLEMYNNDSNTKTVRGTSTATTFNIVASPQITTSNISCLGCSVGSITNYSNYQAVKLTYSKNISTTLNDSEISTLALEEIGGLTLLREATITNGDKTLTLTVQQQSGIGTIIADPEL